MGDERNAQNEQRARQAFNVPLIMQYLAMAADARTDYLLGASEDRGHNVRRLWSYTMGILGEVVGRECATALFSPVTDGGADRYDHLMRLTQHLDLLEGLPCQQGASPSSFAALRWEIEAVANGDEPRLLRSFPRKRGRPANAWRIAEPQLRALAWERYLRFLGCSPRDAKEAVLAAYGISNQNGPDAGWSTVRQWKSSVSGTLGKSYVAHVLEMAGHGHWPIANATLDEAAKGLARDGERYQGELKMRAIDSLDQRAKLAAEAWKEFDASRRDPED